MKQVETRERELRRRLELARQLRARASGLERPVSRRRALRVLRRLRPSAASR
jgi:hypothetical protein